MFVFIPIGIMFMGVLVCVHVTNPVKKSLWSDTLIGIVFILFAKCHIENSCLKMRNRKRKRLKTGECLM